MGEDEKWLRESKSLGGGGVEKRAEGGDGGGGVYLRM